MATNRRRRVAATAAANRRVPRWRRQAPVSGRTDDASSGSPPWPSRRRARRLRGWSTGTDGVGDSDRGRRAEPASPPWRHDDTTHAVMGRESEWAVGPQASLAAPTSVVAALADTDRAPHDALGASAACARLEDAPRGRGAIPTPCGATRPSPCRGRRPHLMRPTARTPRPASSRVLRSPHTPLAEVGEATIGRVTTEPVVAPTQRSAQPWTTGPLDTLTGSAATDALTVVSSLEQPGRQSDTTPASQSLAVRPPTGWDVVASATHIPPGTSDGTDHAPLPPRRPAHRRSAGAAEMMLVSRSLLRRPPMRWEPVARPGAASTTLLDRSFTGLPPTGREASRNPRHIPPRTPDDTNPAQMQERRPGPGRLAAAAAARHPAQPVTRRAPPTGRETSRNPRQIPPRTPDDTNPAQMPERRPGPGRLAAAAAAATLLTRSLAVRPPTGRETSRNPNTSRPERPTTRIPPRCGNGDQAPDDSPPQPQPPPCSPGHSPCATNWAGNVPESDTDPAQNARRHESRPDGGRAVGAAAAVFTAELGRHRPERPRPIPLSYRPMATAIVGDRPVHVSTGPASRRALARVGKRAATTGDTIHLATPRPAPEIIAHELTHVAHPSPVPRFFDDDDRGPEERQAEQVAAIMRRAPILPRSAAAATAATTAAAGTTATRSTASRLRDDLRRRPRGIDHRLGRHRVQRVIGGHRQGRAATTPTRPTLAAARPRPQPTPPTAPPQPAGPARRSTSPASSSDSSSSSRTASSPSSSAAAGASEEDSER